MVRRQLFRGFDWPLFLCVLLLCGIGLVSIYSSTYMRLPGVPYKQMFWIGVSCLAFFITIWIGYRRFLEAAYPFYIVSIIGLLLVLFFADPRLGARRWLGFGPVSLQPSEIMKLATILTLARYFAHRKPREVTAVVMVRGIFLLLLPMFLILEEPDLGTALVFIPIGLAIFFLWGLNIRYFLGVIFGGIGILPFLWFFLKDYQKDRLLVFIDPNRDPLGAGYTVIQSKIAIGSGGLQGKGWLGGTQNLLNFLPERHTDFIFSVIGEEWGFLGSVIFIFLYVFLFERIIAIGSMTRDAGARLCIGGIFGMLLFHVAINIGMTMGFMPVVGLPLPLASYGGSQLIMVMVSLGLVVSIKRERIL